MKHSVRISKIKKREVPPGMRKIVVDDKVYFYTIGTEGCSVTIINSCHKHFLHKYFPSECTWRPKHIAEMIQRELKAPSVLVGA